MSTDPARVVGAALGFIAAMDIDALIDLLDEDVEFELAFMPSGRPLRLRGAAALRALYTSMFPRLSSFSITVEHSHLVDGGAVVISEGNAAAELTDGGQYRNRYIAVMSVRDGRITSWREYNDPLAMTPLLG